MSAELPPNTELEIAHVLFMDVVGYSRLAIDEQTAVVARLTPKLYEGDGAFPRAPRPRANSPASPPATAWQLVFSPAGGARAMRPEICKGLKEQPHLDLRMEFTAARSTP